MIYDNKSRASTAEISSTSALEVRVVGEAALAVTVAELAPSVAEGMIASTPFIASAVSDRAAKPTEGGLYRKIEYTFFLSYQFVSDRQRRWTRSFSPRRCHR